MSNRRPSQLLDVKPAEMPSLNAQCVSQQTAVNNAMKDFIEALMENHAFQSLSFA